MLIIIKSQWKWLKMVILHLDHNSHFHAGRQWKNHTCCLNNAWKHQIYSCCLFGLQFWFWICLWTTKSSSLKSIFFICICRHYNFFVRRITGKKWFCCYDWNLVSPLQFQAFLPAPYYNCRIMFSYSYNARYKYLSCCILRHWQ